MATALLGSHSSANHHLSNRLESITHFSFQSRSLFGSFIRFPCIKNASGRHRILSKCLRRGLTVEAKDISVSEKREKHVPTSGKRTDLKKIMILGAGPIVIGQACEFDYSGTQACKALKEEGYEVILINSNPATIMTDPDLADRTYITPMTPN